MGKQNSVDEKARLKRAATESIALLGGPSKVARKLGILPWAVSKWRQSRIPAERVPEILQLFPGKVEASDLRPDLYPLED